MSQPKNNISIEAVLVSTLFGIVGGEAAYRLMDYPLTYTDFIASNITWAGEGKSKDVLLVFCFTLVSLFSLFWIDRKSVV